MKISEPYKRQGFDVIDVEFENGLIKTVEYLGDAEDCNGEKFPLVCGTFFCESDRDKLLEDMGTGVSYGELLEDMSYTIVAILPDYQWYRLPYSDYTGLDIQQKQPYRKYGPLLLRKKAQ